MKTFTIMLIAAFQLLMLSAACNKNKNGKNGQKGCPSEIICTAEYAMVTITLTDATGNPVVLDSFYTTRQSTGEIIHNQQPHMAGMYSVLEDNYQRKLQQSSDVFVFTGIKDGKVVVTESFSIGADCCHINYKSGKQQVVLPISEDCPSDISCTDQYVMVEVHLEDAGGNAVQLDSFYTTRQSSGEVIRYTQYSGHAGMYSVLEDNYRKKLQKASDVFTFSGYRNGQSVVNEQYTISADCCHIEYQSGKQHIVVP